MDIKQAKDLLGHMDIKTTLNLHIHFGFDDVKADNLETYYYAVKIHSKEKVMPLKHA